MRLLGLLLMSSLLFACDGAEDPDGGVDGPDGSTADGGSDAGPTDAGPTDAGAADAGDTDAGNTDAGDTDAGIALRQATVSLTQTRAESPLHIVYGGFYPDLAAPPIAEEGVVPCAASVMSGACGLYACVLGTRAGAGTLTAEVDGAVVATLSTAASGDYGTSGPGLVAEAGDTVTFRATGDEVPAFSGTVSVPGALTATPPSTVPRDEPLTVTWSTSDAHRAQILIGAAGDAVVCIVDAADGTVTVAPELLGMLDAGAGVFALTVFNFEGVTAGEYRVLLTAGDGVSGATTLE